MKIRFAMASVSIGLNFCFMAPSVSGNTLCPPSIAVKQKITSLPHSWEAIAKTSSYPLRLVTFFEGHPKSKVSLVNDYVEAGEGREVAVWKFVSSKQGYWIECGYDQTSITLTKRLAESVSKCNVTYDPKVSIGGVQMINNIDCS